MTTSQGIREPGVVGYIRIWTDRQGPSEPTYNSQRAAILAEGQRRELPLLYFFIDGAPYGRRLPDPNNLRLAGSGLRMALSALAKGRGSVLAVTEFDRLGELAAMVALRGEDEGWELVALDRMEKPPANAVVRWDRLSSEEQRQRISERTIAALARRRNQGIRLGRPPSLPAGVVEYILGAYASGLGWSAIAEIMNKHQVPTAQGGRRWYPSTVRAVVLGQAIRR